MDTVSTEELVLLCQRTLPEDTRAFEILVTQYKERVVNTAYRLVGHRQEAEDLAQEVFIKVYRSIKRLDDPVTFTSWIYRITTNTCFDALAKQRRRAQTSSLVPPSSDDDQTERDYPDTKTVSPEAAVLQQELRNCLQQTLDNLDVDARAVIVLRDVEGRSYQEIADIFSFQLSATKMRIHRARLAFQRVLEQICPDAWRTGSQTN